MNIIQVGRATRLSAVLVALLTVVAACERQAASDPAQSVGYQLPDNIRYTHHWTAASGVDLLSPAAVVARAFFESMYITMQTDPHSGYPGYEDAVARIRMPYEGGKRYAVYGTRYMYLLRVEQRVPGEFHAVMCSWQHGLAIEKGDHYVGPGPVVPVFASTVDLRAPAEEGSERTSVGAGPARFPSNNVFGEWVVVAADLVADDFGDTELCRSLPDNPVPPELLANPDGQYAEPLPSLPPFPGWPASAGD